MATQFEGAVLLDQKQHPDAYPKEITVVVDVESLEAGICRNGQLIGRTGAEDPEGSLRMSVSGAYAERIAAGMDTVNQAMKHYYSSGKNEDTEAIPQASVLCSQLDQVYSDTGEAMDRLCDRLLDLLDQNRIDENEIQILRIGRLSGYYPYLYSLKKNLSGSVFLADARFIGHTLDQSPSQIIEDAEKQNACEQRFGHDVSLLYFTGGDGRLEKKAFVLAEKERPLAAMHSPQYSPLIYTGEKGVLSLLVDGHERQCRTQLNDEMIQVGLLPDAGTVRIVFRRESDPEHPVYQMF